MVLQRTDIFFKSLSALFSNSVQIYFSFLQHVNKLRNAYATLESRYHSVTVASYENQNNKLYHVHQRQCRMHAVDHTRTHNVNAGNRI